MRPVAFALAALLHPGPAEARKALIGKSRVSFTATGSPGALSFEGRTESIALEDRGETLAFTVPMDTVGTGIALRDRHLRETYVQTATFPDAVLAVPAAGLRLPAAGEAPTGGRVEGSFTVHGVSQPVTVAWSAKPDKLGWKIEASFPFDVTKAGIGVPSYLGVTVEPAMRAEASLRVVEAPP